MLTWLLTFTTYGTWLPGDARGFVGRVRDQCDDDPVVPTRMEHDLPGTQYDSDCSGLYCSARMLMKGEPVWLTKEQAEVIGNQFHETATYRSWTLSAFAIMANHVHLVVSAFEDVLTDRMLQSFKSYASRSLNQRWPKPTSGTWWTQSGSRRLLKDDGAVDSAIRYVMEQYLPWVVYTSSKWTV